MEEKPSLVFIDGMNFQPVPPTAPETIRGKIYFQWSKFKEFAEKNVNERGYLNIQMMKSKEKGSIYFILDTYKPKSTVETQEYNDTKYKTEKETINEEVSDKLFNASLSDEENERLNAIPF